MTHNFAKYSVRLVKDETARYDAPKRVTSASEIAEICRTVMHLHEQPVENLVVILLSTKNDVIGLSTVSVGTLNASLVHPREVLKAAVLSNAYALILAHNHPSGDCTPSTADRAVTNTIKAACDLMQIQLIDHVIIGDEGYYSFRDSRLL